MREAEKWTRGHYLAVSITAVGLIVAAAISTLWAPHPDTKLPSCFDMAAKLKAEPGDRCNPVF